MLRRVALLAAALSAVLLSACSDDIDDPISSDAPACDPALDSAFRAWGNAGFSGVALVSGPAGAECSTGVGLADRGTGAPNTADTVYAIGSISKTFTAAAVAQLEAEGRLGRSDRAGDLLPGLTGPVATATVAQLLLHTSGLTGSHGQDHEPLSRDAAIGALSGLRVDGGRTGEFLYSNAGYSLLALIVDERSEEGYRSFMRERILATGGGFWDGEPAAPGPRAVGYAAEGAPSGLDDFAGPHWALAGNGDLAMSMTQLAAWTRGLFAGEIVSPAALDVLLEPGATDEGGRAMSPGWVHIGADTFGEPALATAGGGGDLAQNVVLAWLPDSRRVLAFASNTADVTAEELLQKVAPALVAGEPLPTPATAPATPPAIGKAAAGAAALAGTYRTSDGALVVETTADGLVIRAQGPSAFAALFPTTAVPAARVEAHEAAVADLLAGRTEAGREELELIAEDEGAVTGTEVLGSVVDDGELRTFVRVRVGAKSLIGWYALDDAGGVEGVDLGGYPVVRLLEGEQGYRVAGTEAITVTFHDSGVTVSGPTATVTGTRS